MDDATVLVVGLALLLASALLLLVVTCASSISLPEEGTPGGGRCVDRHDEAPSDSAREYEGAALRQTTCAHSSRTRN